MIFTALILSTFVSLEEPSRAQQKSIEVLGYDRKKEQDRLERRSYVTTSPHFSNPNNLRFGVGKAIKGMKYNNLSVAADAGISGLKLAIIDLPKLDKGHVYVDMTTLQYDEDDGVYYGQGTLISRSHRHCPMRYVSLGAKVRLFPHHPFRGAFSSIELTLFDHDENTNCQQVTESREQTVTLNRVFLQIELVRAVEEAKRLLSAQRSEMETLISARLVAFNSMLNLMRELKMHPEDVIRHLRVENDKAMQNLRDIMNRLVSGTDNLRSKIIYGGKDKFGDFEHEIPKLEMLDQADATAFQLAGLFFSEVDTIEAGIVGMKKETDSILETNKKLEKQLNARKLAPQP
jgi:hypothetical protein